MKPLTKVIILDEKLVADFSINIMKYFTCEWCWSDIPDDQVEGTLKKYENYINSVYFKLPISLKFLVKSINLHDGIIKKVVFHRSNRILILSGIFGDLEVGYFSLDLEYKNVINLDLDFSAKIFVKKKVEIIRDEIEVVEGGSFTSFFHRFIFSNKSEFQIHFCDCNISIGIADPKDYVKKTVRYLCAK